MAYFQVNKKPRLTFPTLTGSIVTFNSQYAGLPLKSHTVEVVATQSGSGIPSPYNVRPIHGFSEVNIYQRGINQWDEEWELGGIDETTGQNTPSTTTIRSKNYIPCLPNTTYYVKTPKIVRFRWYDADENCIGNQQVSSSNTFTTPSNCYFMRFVVIDTTTYNNNISINYPSTDTSYHPYDSNSNTYTIQLGQEVYGAEVDAKNGVATITHRIVTLDGSEDWQPYQIQGRYFANDVIERRSNLVSLSGYMCDSYIFRGNGDTSSSNVNVDKSVYMQTTYGRVWIYDTDFETAEDLTTYLSSNNVEIVYPLATPFDIQLTPTQIETLIGNNTIFADTGNTTLQYPKFG